MEQSCPHCRCPISAPGALFCPSCKKAVVAFAPAAAEPAAEEKPPPSFDERASKEDRPRAFLITTASSVIIYFTAVIAFFDPQGEQRMVRAFGPAPLGLPIDLFDMLLLTVLFLPIPFGLYQFSFIASQARRDGLPILGWAGIIYLLDVDRYHPHLRRAKWSCVCCTLYFLLIAVAWVVYTTRLGI